MCRTVCNAELLVAWEPMYVVRICAAEAEYSLKIIFWVEADVSLKCAA